MADRSLWFESHLLADRAGRRARHACERLGPTVHQRILSAGDRLASTSPAVAQQFYRHAADVWAGVGETDFERWLQVGCGIVEAMPAARDAALAYFSVPPKVVVKAGIARVQAWRDIGQAVSNLSRKLGATFFENTRTLVDRIAPDVFAAWATEGMRLHGVAGWRGEFLAQAYFAAATEVLPVLGVTEFRRWADLGVALHTAVRERQFFAQLPPGLASLHAEERVLVFDLALAVAALSRPAATVVFQQLPASVRRLHGAARQRLLQVLGLAGTAAAEALPGLVPVIGALVHDLPRQSRLAALDLAATVAQQFARGTVALLRSLPTAYENARHDAVAVWVARGLEIAADNPEAGVAFFALESRTSLKVLHASSTAAVLADVQGLLRKYVHMLSGQSVSIRSADSFQLRPSLEEFPLENEIALPLKIDVFSTHEENCDVYQFLAAQLAGRREFGTYDAELPAEAKGNLLTHLRDAAHSPLLEEMFLLAEGFRIAAALARTYPGLARQQQALAARFLLRQDARRPGAHPAPLDGVLAWLLCGQMVAEAPDWLQPLADVIVPCVAPLASRSATVNEALAVAHTLTAQLAAEAEPRQQMTYGELALDRAMAEALVDPYLDDDTPLAREVPNVETEPAPPPALSDDVQLQLDQTDEPGTDATSPLSAEELKRLLESGADLRIKQGYGSDVEGLGLYITDLLGKVPAAQLEELRQLLAESTGVERLERRRWLERRTEGVSYYYDEWDYHIADYRQRWCRLLEIALDGDSGEFFNQALVDYARLIPEIRRQFQRIRPEMYRIVRGLEDGEDFDLNAVVDARVDRRARRPPSPKVYVARTREERDVATLFLIDMSASTDEPLQKPQLYLATEDGIPARPPMARQPPARRIIDVTKEALVVMAQALEEIGDAFAIYGFSGHGRDNVEFYMVKSFNESLTTSVKGRIGAIEPKRSTRMGTALRHATEKMASVSSRSRHIIMLSDGFPQDFDYGQDRRSNVYGLRDTTVALRECEAAGITPFCITVDKAGHDYLREMCDASRYMVIDDITALPRELPKIYQRVVGA